jgi:flagellar motor switch protein FliM
VGYSEQATAARRRRGEARTYDFRRPVRLAREHAHLLRVAMATFGRQATTVLTTSLRAVCLLNPAVLEELSYDEFLSGVCETSVSAILSLDPLPGKALLNMDASTVLTMIDHQLGGPGSLTQPDRPLTDIEQALVRSLLNRMLRELAYAFEPIAHITPTLLALESNAQFVQAAAATDPVVVSRMELQVGQRSSEATLCLPYAMLAPALDQLVRASQDGERTRLRHEAAQRTTRRLTDVAVDVSVRFSPVRLRSSQIAALEVGDVLTLGHRTTTPLTVTSAATTFAHAVPGSSGRRLAVLIVDSPAPERRPQ